MLSLNCKHVQHVKISILRLSLTSISDNFLNKGRKVLKAWQFYEKRAITPTWVMGFTLINTFRPLFKKLSEIDVKLKRKIVHHVEIYLPCNYKVNPIAHFGVVALFSSNFLSFNSFHSKMGNQIYLKIAG
jgi:hypothetical protein